MELQDAFRPEARWQRQHYKDEDGRRQHDLSRTSHCH
jgi:hypothetical protein